MKKPTPKPKKAPIAIKPLYPMRINKYMALKQYATRREADELISSGIVFINGKKAVLGDTVNQKDKVEVKTTAPKEGYRYFAYNKPVGVVTSLPAKDEKSILDVTEFPIKVFPLGRLDKESTGLIIMTNDGRITDKLLNPKNIHEKEYVVTVDKPIEHNFLVNLINGIRLGEYVTKKAKARRIDKHTFEIIITEGKNRQIRRMCASFGYNVKTLTRIRVMNILLGTLKPGTFKEISGVELDTLLASLGIAKR